MKAPRITEKELKALKRQPAKIPARRKVPVEKKRSARPAKYRNKKVETPDGVFDSQAEARRWADLKLLAQAGHIFNLVRQVRIPLHQNRLDKEGNWVAKDRVYIADFVYTTTQAGAAFALGCGDDRRISMMFHPAAVVEDAKGVRTREFKNKAKQFLLEYGFAITEVAV